MTDSALGADLREAIAQGGDLHLEYLPEVSFATGRVDGMDALARWTHPERGPIPPAQFIRLAEENGLLHALTEWTIKTAFRQCRVWRDDGYEFTVSVNLSPVNLRDERLPRIVSGQAKALNVKPEWIRLEIEQKTIADADESVTRCADALRAAGVRLVVDNACADEDTRVAIDRVGAGAVKFDRSIVSTLTDPRVADAMRATIATAKERGLLVLAEGIEDRETYDALKAMGCDGGLGYLISHAISPLDLATWIYNSPWGLGR